MKKIYSKIIYLNKNNKNLLTTNRAFTKEEEYLRGTLNLRLGYKLKAIINQKYFPFCSLFFFSYFYFSYFFYLYFGLFTKTHL